MIVYNEAEFIERNLRNHYKFADEIIIIEGAVKEYAKITGAYTSTDNTIGIIETFPDIFKKITLVKPKRAWKDKIKMQNEFVKRVTGDILFKIDADEFYKPEDIEKVLTVFERNPELVMVYPYWYHFYQIPNTVLKGDRWNEPHCKIWRFNSRYRYKTTHNRLSDGDIEISHKTRKVERIEGFYCYHYSYLKPQEWLNQKYAFLKARDDKWYGQEFGEVVPFDGVHPKVLRGHPKLVEAKF